MDKIYFALDNMHVYMDWYITILCLNANIDKTKVSKHPIHYKTFEEFNSATLNTSRMDEENKLQHWKRIHNL